LVDLIPTNPEGARRLGRIQAVDRETLVTGSHGIVRNTVTVLVHTVVGDVEGAWVRVFAAIVAIDRADETVLIEIALSSGSTGISVSAVAAAA
jgi:hypothetical protein